MDSVLQWLGTLGWVEWSAFITGVICVFLIVIEKDVNWPIGVINSILLIYCFWTQKLWATVGLQVFYTGECLYGWWKWTRRDELTGLKVVRIGNTPWGMTGWLTLIGVVATAGLYPVLRYFEDPYPFWDALVGVASLIAEYLLCLKMRQAWSVYFFCDFITMAVLYQLGRYGPVEYRNIAWVTLAQYVVFTFLCLAGMFEWKRRFLRIRLNNYAAKEAICPGCGKSEIHKMCPAHGTPVYMNPNHPDWGKA